MTLEHRGAVVQREIHARAAKLREWLGLKELPTRVFGGLVEERSLEDQRALAEWLHLKPGRKGPTAS